MELRLIHLGIVIATLFATGATSEPIRGGRRIASTDNEDASDDLSPEVIYLQGDSIEDPTLEFIYDYNDFDDDFSGITLRIVGGDLAETGAYPYFVHLGNCAGVLIDPKIVLTVAHCVPSRFLRQTVQVGATTRDNGTKIKVVATATHPGYGIPTSLNLDYGLMLLEEPYDMNSDIEVKLNSDDAVPIDDESLYVMGMGTTEFQGKPSPDLLDVELPAISNMECKAHSPLYDRGVTENMICAGRGEGKDACQGDSGAPLVKKVGNTHIAIGLVSGGVGCATSPGIYARISKGADWIREQICTEWKEGSVAMCGDDNVVPTTSSPTIGPRTNAPTTTLTMYPSGTPVNFPTQFPTSTPTNLPSKAPTAYPSGSPTKDCVSDDPNFLHKLKEGRDCSWVARRPYCKRKRGCRRKGRCNKKHNGTKILEICKATCRKDHTIEICDS